MLQGMVAEFELGVAGGRVVGGGDEPAWHSRLPVRPSQRCRNLLEAVPSSWYGSLGRLAATPPVTG